ncbi:hypothetical protein [Salinimicrobium sp. WS361]|jgi:hypothetical protein|uniref:hypothetical protein n=1 Tax=Salinimicrobium sp. WS361 TaxID=3425123 RepID=UPI003D701506
MEKLTLYTFKLLPDQEQYDLVFTKGDFITTREEGNSRFALYALEKFFVEVEYDVQNNKIVNKVSFISGEKLNVYNNLKF